MDNLWKWFRDFVDFPIFIIIVGIFLLVVGGYETITIGENSFEFSQSDPTQLFLVIFSTLIILLGIFIGIKDKTIKERKKITLRNKKLINHADNKIISFSGDLSWIGPCSEEIMKALDRNVLIRILCKDPISNKSKELVIQYMNQNGMELRYYGRNPDPDLRGLMIEPNSLKRILIVEKKHKKNGFKYVRDGNPGNSKEFEYWGKEYSNQHDFAIVNPIVNHFNILWDQGEKVSVFSEQTHITNIELELRKVTQYRESNIVQKRVYVNDLKPILRFIDRDDYQNIINLANRYKYHNLQLWNPVKITTPDYKKIICPPIIEKHGNDYFIIDGLKRLFLLKERSIKISTVILIENVNTPLPADPIDWNQIVIGIEKNNSKRRKFKKYNDKNWRYLKTFHNELIINF